MSEDRKRLLRRATSRPWYPHENLSERSTRCSRTGNALPTGQPGVPRSVRRRPLSAGVGRQGYRNPRPHPVHRSRISSISAGIELSSPPVFARTSCVAPSDCSSHPSRLADSSDSYLPHRPRHHQERNSLPGSAAMAGAIPGQEVGVGLQDGADDLHELLPPGHPDGLALPRDELPYRADQGAGSGAQQHRWRDKSSGRPWTDPVGLEEGADHVGEGHAVGEAVGVRRDERVERLHQQITQHLPGTQAQKSALHRVTMPKQDSPCTMLSPPDIIKRDDPYRSSCGRYLRSERRAEHLVASPLLLEQQLGHLHTARPRRQWARLPGNGGPMHDRPACGRTEASP
jgi:hypothetical protein